MIVTVCGKLRRRKSMPQLISTSIIPSQLNYPGSSLARGLKIIAVKVRETSTNVRNCFSQLCSASLKSRPWPPSPQRGTAAQEVILSHRSFQCSTFTLTGWMGFLCQAIHFSIFSEHFFLRANTSFSQVFLHYRNRAALMTHN